MKVERLASRREGRDITDAAADHWDRTALRREQLNDRDVGQILQALELNNALNGRTSMTAVYSTRGTGTKGTPY
jgi:hypothetical protein